MNLMLAVRADHVAQRSRRTGRGGLAGRAGQARTVRDRAEARRRARFVARQGPARRLRRATGASTLTSGYRKMPRIASFEVTASSGSVLLLSARSSFAPPARRRHCNKASALATAAADADAPCGRQRIALPPGGRQRVGDVDPRQVERQRSSGPDGKNASWCRAFSRSPLRALHETMICTPVTSDRAGRYRASPPSHCKDRQTVSNRCRHRDG